MFRGRSVAAGGSACGEAVFTTGMTGYQETVTDPSYAEQLVCFTAPMVGNYGVDESRLESAAPHARAVVMRRLGGEEWALWLAEQGVVALDEIDTRALTLRLRDEGAMRAVAVADERAFPVADALDHVRAQPDDGGRGARRPGLDPCAVRRRAGGRRAGRARRLRGEALHRPPALACGRRGHHLPARCRSRRARRLRRRPSLQRPRRPRAARRGDRRRPRDPRPRAGARDLPGAPAARACDRARDREAAVRPPGREPPGARPPQRPRPRDESEPRLRSRTDGWRRGNPRLVVRRHGGGLRLPRACAPRPSSSIRRQGPARTTRGPCSRAGSKDCGRRVPARRDLRSVCVIGSGPIVIGQACEFDYAGCQALKVLREDGYRTIVVNSNPATIMTDPGFADRTYIEPLDLESVADVLRRERPDGAAPHPRRADRAQPRDGARGGRRPRRARGRAARRDRRRDPSGRGPRALPRRRAELRPGRPRVSDRRVARRPRREPRPRRRPPGVHARRPRRRVCRGPRRALSPGRARPRGEPDRTGARRGVDPRVGRVRARGDQGPRGQRRDRLLDREPRPDGRPHWRLGHGRAADDALRRGVPGAARRRRGGDPGGRRGDGRLEHPVRAQPRHRRAPRDRDEPASLALLRPGVQGDGLPDRQGRRQARRRLHARRDPERPHEDDARELRADARLRRREVPALRLREVPRRRRHARDADEVGRRGDGDRTDVHRGVPQGVWLARARPRLADPVGDDRRPAGRPAPLVRRAARGRQAGAPHGRHPPGEARGLGRRLDRRGVGRVGRRRAPDALRAWDPSVVPPGRLVRRRGRGGLELLLLDVGGGGRGAARGRRTRAS